MTDRRLVLLDTDIGNDIDDAVCLAYLLAQPACELLGITTVTADPVARARLASVLCRHAGRDEIPIYPGAADPWIGPPVQQQPPQAAVLDRWPHRASFPAGEAMEFLRQTIRAHPDEVTLLTIGPLTNVALLFAVDPEIPRLLGQLVMMGGSYLTSPRSAEWNMHCDPHAAARVLAAPVRRLSAVGLDVTMRVQMPVDEFRARFAVPALVPVADMAESWFPENSVVRFHDPLAAATLFAPDLCDFAGGEITLGTARGELAGLTSWHPAADGGRHRVAVDVRAAAALDHYFSVVG